ncbi:uL13 family ribosomal protein [Candidatus Hodgkinia cicadicola]
MRWYVINLSNKPLGRAASAIAKLLNTRVYNAYGKRAHQYRVLLVNFDKLLISKRLLNKRYWYHSGYPGGLKCKLASQFSVSELFSKVLSKMLPNTRMRRALLNNVRLFASANISALTKHALYLDL